MLLTKSSCCDSDACADCAEDMDRDASLDSEAMLSAKEDWREDSWRPQSCEDGF